MMNKVILIGRMGKDPDLKTFASGGALANLRVITNQSWKDRQTGAFKERTDGHNVVVHQADAAKRLASVLKKGDLVQIEGTLENRQWTDRDGHTRWTTEIVVRGGGGTVKRLGTRNLAAAERHAADSHTAEHTTGEAEISPTSSSPMDHTSMDESPPTDTSIHTEIDFFDDGFGDGFPNG